MTNDLLRLNPSQTVILAPVPCCLLLILIVMSDYLCAHVYTYLHVI